MDNLKSALFASHLKSKVTTLQKAHGKVEAKCELCIASSNAVAFCQQCCCFICNECVQHHFKNQIFFNHTKVPLEDLKSGRVTPIAVEESSTVKCDVHEEPLAAYDCSCLICQHCILKDHKDHNFEFTKKAAPETKTMLLEEIQPLKSLQKELTKAAEKVCATTLEVEEQKQTSINNIHTAFEELHNILKQREQELVKDTTTVAQIKLKTLCQQKKALSLASAKLQSVVAYNEQCVSHSADNELVMMEAEIRKIIQQMIQEHCKLGRSLEPIEEADMDVEIACAEALQQLCLTQANVITTAVNPGKPTVKLTAPPEVGKPFLAILTTRHCNGKPNDSHQLHEISSH